MLKPAAACKVKHSPAAEEVSIKYSPGPFLGSSAGVNTSMNFLEIDIGSAGSALGGAYVSVVDDATACFWNPAGLTGSLRNNMIFIYEPWLLDIEHYFIANSS